MSNSGEIFGGAVKVISSFCSHGACVEVEMKSSFSGGSGGNNCVDAEKTDNDFIVVRDTKEDFLGNSQPTLTFTREEWDAFIKGVKAGEFDF